MNISTSRSEEWRVKSECWKPLAVFFLFFYLFSLISSLAKLRLALVGLDGLEPSTSRLSGARSNHLSYKPLLCVDSFPSFSARVALRRGHCPLVEMMGFEPMTPCVQGRCSPNWATPPYHGLFLFKDHCRSLKIEQQKICTLLSVYRPRRLVWQNRDILSRSP